jgi:hypothetical protein
MEMKFKEEKENFDKIEGMKKDIKIMIAKCDSVLEVFEELATEKSDPDTAKNKLITLDSLIEE